MWPRWRARPAQKLQQSCNWRRPARGSAWSARRCVNVNNWHAISSSASKVGRGWGATTGWRTQLRVLQEARARRQQQLRDEEAAEHGLPDATVSFDVRCHSVAVAAASDRHLSDVGDRVALPPSALQALMAARVVLPVCFRVQVVDGGRGPMYCGVAEFNAPDGVAYLPRWMMSALGADEGSLLRFSSVVLPQGTGVVLRPHRAGWRSLNQSDAGASLLADQFSRHYATLTAGATIELAAPSGGLFEFDVVSVAPDEAGAVSLLQADLAVELLPPLEDEALPLLPLGGHGTSGGGVGSRIPFFIIRPPVEGHVARTHYIYFALTLGAGQGALVRVSSSVGEADAYCSSTTRAPTDCDFQVCTVDAEAQLPSSSVARTWVVGVTCASDGPATFRLGAELAPTQQQQQQQPLQAGEMCGNCRKSIPTQSMALHALRCRHVVHYCAECALPMSMQSRAKVACVFLTMVCSHHLAKHEAVMHATVTCRCGASFARHLVPVHAADCPLRPVKCVYCGGTVTEAERPEHTGLCGHKRARCVHCEHAGKRNEMARHAQVKHGVFKPEPRSDWHLE